MSNRNLILTVAKVIIAAAWADGEITNEEINSLKDLLFHLPQASYKQGTRITGREWATLEIYMQSPVSAAERSRLVEQLQNALRTRRDRELAISALEDLVRADGVVTDEELNVMQEIKTAIEAIDLGIFAPLGRLVRGPLHRRSEATANAPDREQFLDDFIKNRIFFAVRERLQTAERDLNIPEGDLRKLSLAGGLMARVAHTDHGVSQEEFDVMVDALQKCWDISQEAAAFVAEVAASKVSADLDYYRLTREFSTSTTADECACFLDVLFAVANADGHITHDETEEIRRIASGLNLTHQEFIDAKLRALHKR